MSGSSSTYSVDFKGFVPLSTLDWPGRAVMLVGLGRCNFSCCYCQNQHLPSRSVPLRVVEEEIRAGSRFISGVVFTGGEPTLQPEQLAQLAGYAKELGLMVGLETNGSQPEVVKGLAREGLLDAVFLDVKAPLKSNRGYQLETGCDLPDITGRVIAVLRLDVTIEARTTVFRHNQHLVPSIARDLEQVKKKGPYSYVLQEGVPENTRTPHLEALTRQELLELARKAAKHVESVKIRTRERGLEAV